MIRLILTLLFFTAIPGYTQIYDCFLFFNEIELLKMRLEELDEVVDYFVLVECIETQRGDLKPLYFNENRHLFEKYLPKIIHVIVEERYPELQLWSRENFQRNCIVRGLQGCNSSDIILVSDLDEIPRSEVIQPLPQLLTRRSLKLIRKGKEKEFKKHNNNKAGPGKSEKMFYLKGALALEMPIYFFQLNRSTPNKQSPGGGPWIGTVATTYEIFIKFGAQHFRDYRWKFLRICNAGWHFSWMGGQEKVKQKLRSIVEGTKEEISDDQANQWLNSYEIFPIDESFPKYVHKNLDYLRSIGFIGD